MSKQLNREASGNILSNFKRGSYQANFKLPKKAIEPIAVADLMDIVQPPIFKFKVKSSRPIATSTSVNKKQPTKAEKRQVMRESIYNRSPREKMDVVKDEVGELSSVFRNLRLS